MALRTRLSLAFVFVVLVPVVVGAILAGVVAPHVLHGQVSSRLSTARTSVSDVLAARCAHASDAARLLGLQVAAIGPDAAVRDAVEHPGIDYAVVAGTAGIVASSGTLPGAPSATPTPAVLGSCVDGKDASFALAARAQLAIADRPDLREVAVAYSISKNAAASLAAGLDGRPDVTLLSGDAVVATTLPAQVAAGEARAINGKPAGVLDSGSRVLAFTPSSSGQPYDVIVSEPQPDTTKLVWLLVAVVVVTIAAGVAIGRWLARIISRPIAELSDAAARVASGDLETSITVRSRDEVGRLATAFNDMTTELRSYIGRLQQSRDELRRNLDRLGATLAHTHDLGGILRVVLETAITSVGATGGAIMFLDADNNLTVRARSGPAAESIPDDARVPLGTGITGAVAASGEPVAGVVGDGPGLRPAVGEPSATTVIAVPLKQSGRVVGVLNLYDKEGGNEGGKEDGKEDVAHFTEHDVETIQAFASQASVAIDNVLLHQEAQRLSLTDPLTGLWNYRYLTLALGHEIERATRFSRPLALLMLDLDRFKQINDQHGHQVGDAVLIELAARMRAEIREVDTLARYGGEEFVVVLPETDAAGAARTADRLGAVLRSAPFCADTSHSLVVTASIGAAVFPAHGTTPSQLLRSADDALYQAKDAGRDRWRFATSASDDAEISLMPAPESSDDAAARAFDETSPLAHPPATGVVVMPDAGRAEQPHGPRLPDA